jgi:hypothetical protein
MLKPIAVVVLPALLAACAPETYKPYGKTSQPMEAALKECEAKARAAHPSKTAIAEIKISMARQESIDTCMAEKNYIPSRG